MKIREYTFADQLAMSDGVSASASVKDIIMENIPSALSVRRSSVEDDKKGTDWWVECPGGKYIGIDCKVRSEDYSIKPRPEDDLALETFSVVPSEACRSGVVGWTRDEKKQADYILWVWNDTGRWVLIPFQMLCHVFKANWQHWKNAYKTRQQHTPGRNGGYKSECVFVPRREIWRQIYLTYAGPPKQSCTDKHP